MALKPYQQGSLDSLCGVYAIINAFQWGLRDLAPLSKKSCKYLQHTLSEHLENRGLLSTAINYGITSPVLSQLIKVSREWVLEEKGIALTTQKPFHSKQGVILRTLSSKLNCHLSSPHTATVMVTAGRLYHWTVATSVNSRSIAIWDSAGMRRFTLRNCTCVQPSKGNGRTLQIVPSGLFLFRFNPAS